MVVEGKEAVEGNCYGRVPYIQDAVAVTPSRQGNEIGTPPGGFGTRQRRVERIRNQYNGPTADGNWRLCSVHGPRGGEPTRSFVLPRFFYSA